MTIPNRIAKKAGLLKMLTPLVATLALSAALVACSAKSVPLSQHEGPLDLKTTAAPRTVEASAKDFKSIQIDKVHTQIADEKSPEKIKEILQNLGRFVMNANYVENTEYNTTPELRAILTYYNTGLERLAQMKPELLEAAGASEGLLETYERMVFSNCDAELKGCKNVSFFRSDARSSRILHMMVRKIDLQIDTSMVKHDGLSTCEDVCLQQVQRYYRLLAMASDIGAKGKNLEQEFFYLKRAREYAIYFQKLSEDQRSSQATQRHAKIFEDIIANYPANPKDPAFEKFVLNFGPWTYSHLEPNPFPYGTKRMFAYAAGNYLYQDQGKTRLAQGLADAIKKSQIEADRLGPSFSQILTSLREKNPIVFKTLLDQKDLEKLNATDFQNEYFFMVDRLYRGHLDVDEVAQIWLGSSRKQEIFLSTIEIYMKIQVLNMLEETNAYMRDAYQSGNFDSSSLVKEVVERSKDISDRWIDMHSRFDYISILLGRQLKGQVANQRRLEKTTTMVDSIRRNIKYLSVYPNMMLLSYFMSKTSSSLRFTTWYGKSFDVSPVTVVGAILDGKLEPWFRFGNNDDSINHTEILYAYYFALSTGAFETFAKVGQNPNASSLPSVDRKVFLPEMMRLYLSSEQAELNNGLRFLKQTLPSSTRMGALERACSFEAAQRDDYKIALNLEDFGQFTLSGTGSGSLVADLQDFYSNSYGPGTEIQIIRSDLDNKLIFIDTMAKLLLQNMQNMRALNSSEADIQEMTGFLNGEVGKVQQLKVDYYNEALAFHRKFDRCYSRLMNRERDRQKQLVAMERQHLGYVFEIMQALQSVPDDQVEAALPDIVNHLKQDGKIPQSYSDWKFEPGLDRIEKNTYRYTQVEFYLRLKRWSEQLKPSVDVNPVADLTRLNSYTNSTTLQLRDTDGNIIGKEDFIRSGLKMLNGYDSAFAKWFQETTKLAPLTNRLGALIQLYKLGLEMKLAPDKRIQADEVLDAAMDVVRWIDIDDEEVVLLKDIGLPRRTQDRKEWHRILLDMTANEQKVSLFERVYDLVRSNETKLNEAKEFANSFNTVGYFLFAPDQKVGKIMRDNYLPLVTDGEAIVADFEAAIARREAQDAQLISANPATAQIRYELTNGGAMTYTTELKANGAPIYLDPMKKLDQKNRMKSYHEEQTENFFKQQPGQ